MIIKESPTWPAKMEKLAKDTDYDGSKVLALMGEDIKGALQQSISDFSAVPLSKTTLVLRELYGNKHSQIRARDVLAAQKLVAEGFQGASGTQAHPLIWTNHMRDSVTFDVSV